MRRARLLGPLWRWHRRAGLLAALFVVHMAVSGIVLNHAGDLGLDRAFIGWGWLRAFYGEKPAGLLGFAVGGQWVTRAGDGVLRLDERRAVPCAGELRGATEVGGLLVAACERELLLLTREGELVEALGETGGLPAPLLGLALDAARVWVLTSSGWQSLDTEAMSLARAPPPAGLHALAPGELPAGLGRALAAQSEWLSWERLLLDLHSGRLFGRAGELVVDVAALLFTLLALSGVCMWWLHHRPRRDEPRSGR